MRRNSKTWWRRTTATLLGVSFGSYRRSRRDVLMRCRAYVPLRGLNNIPLIRCRVFHLRLVWDVVVILWWGVVFTSNWNAIKTFQYDVVETNHWDILATSHRDVAGPYKKTLLWHHHNVLLPGGTDRLF